MVSRMRAAGAILVGKTNTPEWGAGSHTYNRVFGATRNPWDTTRSAGGSSGGAAVALACRLLPVADGSDLGGSLRNPAAWSGVLGLRPTPGLVPRGPVSAPWLPFAVEGPMARTAGDLALLLGAMAGHDPRDPLSQRNAGVDTRSPLTADLRGRRVAWSPTLGGLPIDPAVRDALAGALPLLAEIGLDVVADEPDLAGADEVFETWRAFMSATGLGEELDARGGELKATVRAEVERGRALTAAQLVRATSLQAALAERALAFFDALRLPRVPGHPGRPVPARAGVRDRGRRRPDGLVHRVDAVELAHQRDLLPRDLDPGRNQRARPARRPAARDAAVRRARAARGRARARAAHRAGRPLAAGGFVV